MAADLGGWSCLAGSSGLLEAEPTLPAWWEERCTLPGGLHEYRCSPAFPPARL